MDFPSNSKVVKSSEEAPETTPEKKVVLKVVEGEAIRRKQPLGSRLKSMFLDADIKGSIENAIVDVMIPTAKDMLFDMFVQTLRTAAYGNNPSDARRTIGTRLVGTALGHTDYGRYSKPSRRDEDSRPGLSRAARSQHNFEEIILPARRDAVSVLETMQDIVDHYGSVTISDLYDMVGEESTFADQKYGWTDVSDARPRPVRNGFLLDLPRPEPLKIR